MAGNTAVIFDQNCCLGQSDNSAKLCIMTAIIFQSTPPCLADCQCVRQLNLLIYSKNCWFHCLLLFPYNIMLQLNRLFLNYSNSRPTSTLICNYHARAIRHICHLISTDLVQTLTCSSRLDNCNALLHGAPASSIQSKSSIVCSSPDRPWRRYKPNYTIFGHFVNFYR